MSLFCGPLAYLPHPFQSPLWNAEMVLCGGNRALQLAETNGSGRDEMDGAHGWAGQREVEKKGKEETKEGSQEGRKPKKFGWHQRAGVGDRE